MTTPAIPATLNPLETLLLAVQAGNAGIAELLDALLNAEVFILLDKDPQQDEDADASALPMLLNNPRGEPVLAAFTAAERSIAMTMEFPAFCFALPVALKKLLPTIRPGVGLVINPGTILGLEIPAASLAKMQAEAVLH
ncbi:MAG: SseB family protein [bacterium]|nr:SseB family protein [bacterium]